MQTASTGKCIMNNDEKKKLIMEDPDFIDSPRNRNSLKYYISKNEGRDLSFSAMAKMLDMTEAEILIIYESALLKLRKHFK